jgi:RimJ/RimL family protein N-acetyltransferase
MKKLKIDKIKLRALTSDDMPKTLSWHNQPDIVHYYSGHPFPVNPEMERKWYDKILTSNFPVTVFGIELLENNSLVGISVLKDINMINRVSEFAIYIGEKTYRKKGIAQEASLKTLEFGFHRLGLNRIFLKVFEENEPAIHLYQQLGFQKEGLLRNSVFKNNVFKNEIIFGMLKEEFNG